MFDEREGRMFGVNGGGDGGGGGDARGNRDGAGATHLSRDWRAIDQDMRRVAARRAELDVVEARLLLEAKRAELHKHLGYGSFAEYLERVIGYAPNTGRDRVRVAEELEELPAIAAAWAEGRLAYSAVREITRIATPATEAKVLAYVDGLTVREVIGAMRGLEKGDDPDQRREPFSEPRPLRMELPPETYAMFLAARRHLEEAVGHPMTDAQFMAVACRAVLDGGSAVRADDHARPNVPPYQVAIVTCPECKRGWHDIPGQSIELSPSAIERAHCDAVLLGRVDECTDEPPDASRTLPATMRRAVSARDHHRCRVPGCTLSTFVDIHHIDGWANTRTHRMDKLVTLCGLHHAMHHDKAIIISGTADALVVTHADGRPYGTPPPPLLPPAPRRLKKECSGGSLEGIARKGSGWPPHSRGHPEWGLNQ